MYSDIKIASNATGGTAKLFLFDKICIVTLLCLADFNKSFFKLRGF